MSETALWFSVVALVGAIGAVVFSVFALFFPRDPPDVSAVNRRITELSLEVTDIADKTGQFIRRQAVRNTREGKQSAVDDSTSARPVTKDQLRAKVRANRTNSQGIN